MNIKTILESRKHNTEVWLRYCERKFKTLKSLDSSLIKSKSLIKTKRMSVEQVATSGNRFKHCH